MKKKKAIIIALCVVIVVLVRVFTPYLGRPFLIYCDNGEKKGLYISNKVKKIEIDSADDPCLRFIRYCDKLEKVSISSSSEINLDHITNPNLKELYLFGKYDNWSSLNKCTELKYLRTFESGFSTIEDISELKNLEKLKINTTTELSLNKLNELKNIKELEIFCQNDIDCDNFSQLEKLEILSLGYDVNITGLDKIDSVKSLSVYQNNSYNPRDIDCEDFLQMENLETLHLSTYGEITGLNKIDSIKSLSISRYNSNNPRDIDCEELLQMKNLEILYLSTYGKIYGLDKMDSVKSLTLDRAYSEIGNDICDMDSLRELKVNDTKFKFSDEIESALREKGVSVEYEK